MEPIEFDIGKALTEAGLTWSNGYMRDNHTVKEVVEAIRPVLKRYEVIPKEC